MVQWSGRIRWTSLSPVTTSKREKSFLTGGNRSFGQGFRRIMARVSGWKMKLALLTAVCVIGLGNFARCDDPDGVLDFCIAVIPRGMGVWETGTEEGDWSQGMDPSKMGVHNATQANVTSMATVLPCKDSTTVVADDFTFKGLASAAIAKNRLGSVVTPAFVNQFPGLNTLEISAARIDFAKGGVNPPHVHPRASELLFVVEGYLDVGFVSADGTLFEKKLQPGDLFTFPKGLVHFQVESGHGDAVAIAFLGSQNPGVSQIATALFGSRPNIPADVLEKSFGIDEHLLGSLTRGVGTLLH